MKKSEVCCLCKNRLRGYGNNPYPAVEDENARCCDRCNMEIVVPMRMILAYSGKRGDK